MMDVLRVAIVGAGPAGMYLADSLAYQRDQPVQIDLFDRLPTPFGLLRYGVAPDHLKMKSLADPLQRILDDPRVRFFGNVEVGRDLMVSELRERYHAVAYTFGASSDRQLNVPGEELPGSTSATEFVRWYSGHPDVSPHAFDLTRVTSAVVVGVGNVAVDVARVLVKDAGALRLTDIPPDALAQLEGSGVTDVHVLGRRGPLHARFTPKELRELGELAGVDVIVDPTQLELTEHERAQVQADPVLSRNFKVLTGWAERGLTGASRRLHLHFWKRPVEVLGCGTVEGVSVEPTSLEGGRLLSAGPPAVMPAQLVLRSVGYRGTSVVGVPFSEDSCTVPHEEGRVSRGGSLSPGEYVAGWIARGPTGVIGTNKSDAEGVAQRMLADTSDLRSRSFLDDDVHELLNQRGCRPVSAAGWARIDIGETALGAALGRSRVKLATWEQLLDAGRSEEKSGAGAV